MSKNEEKKSISYRIAYYTTTSFIAGVGVGGVVFFVAAAIMAARSGL